MPPVVQLLSAAMLAVSAVAHPPVLHAGGRVIPEAHWRASACAHADRVRSLLEPGMLPPAPACLTKKGLPSSRASTPADGWRPLYSAHPVFNFFEQYYGVAGGKGTRRLARWSAPVGEGGCAVLLEGATASDLGSGTLHLRGATVVEAGEGGPAGVLYDAVASRPPSLDATPFLWHRAVLAATTAAEPVTHCYGLHEWAMQYWPEGAPEPPSARYQSGAMRLRVSRSTLNAAVETGVSCTHVDALRFFAPAAAIYNRHGGRLERSDQLRLEQPGCVHAHMDLLKAAIRLSPWLAADLLGDCLEIALAARALDVAASPYDASAFGLRAIQVETASGRSEYREEQLKLMHAAAPVRARLLAAFDSYLSSAFTPDQLAAAAAHPKDERFAVATPAGPPWRRALLPRPPPPAARGGAPAACAPAGYGDTGGRGAAIRAPDTERGAAACASAGRGDTVAGGAADRDPDTQGGGAASRASSTEGGGAARHARSGDAGEGEATGRAHASSAFEERSGGRLFAQSQPRNRLPTATPFPTASATAATAALAALCVALGTNFFSSEFSFEPAYYLALTDLLGPGGGAPPGMISGSLGGYDGGAGYPPGVGVYSGTGMTPLPRLSPAEELVGLLFGPQAPYGTRGGEVYFELRGQ